MSDPNTTILIIKMYGPCDSINVFDSDYHVIEGDYVVTKNTGYRVGEVQYIREKKQEAHIHIQNPAEAGPAGLY